VTVYVVGVPAAGVFTTTASATGTWSVTAAGNLAVGNTATVKQIILQGGTTSAISPTAIA
jgi:hypothetical protein